ncbi:MAG: hypothetical protein GY915_05670, partial [bacterium]|nr:hypothetical protein [bacterium]
DELIEDAEPRFKLGDLVKKKDSMPASKTNLGRYDVGLVIGVFSSYHSDFGRVVYVHILWQTDHIPTSGRSMTVLTQGCLEKVYEKNGNDPAALKKSKQLDIRRMYDKPRENDEE